MFKNVVVGVDGSEGGRNPVALARRLVDSNGELTLGRVRPRRLQPAPTPDEDAVLENMLAEARAEIAAFGDVRPRVAYGRPADELALYSDSLDLLVVGSRSYGPLGRLMHGATSQQLARNCRCPLLVLPRVGDFNRGDYGDASSRLCSSA